MSLPSRSPWRVPLPFLVALAASVAAAVGLTLAGRRAVEVPPAMPHRVCVEPGERLHPGDPRAAPLRRRVETVAEGPARARQHVHAVQRPAFGRETRHAPCDVIV